MKQSRLYAATLLAAAAIAALAVAAQDAVKLVRSAKVGDTRTYKIDAEMQVMGTAAKFSAKSIEKVEKVDQDGSITIEESTTEAKVMFGDQQMEVPSSAARIKSKPNGELIELSGAEVDETAYRRAALTLVVFPSDAIKPGHKWSVESKASPVNGNTAGKGDYEFVAVEKVGEEDAAVINFSYVETSGPTPASASGKLWVSVKDGSLVKLDAEYKQAPLPQIGPTDMKVSVKRA